MNRLQPRWFSHARSFKLISLIIAVCCLAGCSAQPVSPTLIATPSIAALVTSAPTSTPSPKCEYDAKFIQDLSVPDGMHMMPGTVFTKTWQIRNISSCAWTIDYQLKFIGGSHLNESIVNLPRSIPVSDTLDLSIGLTAPITAGQYRARWRLFAADGTPFGPTLFADISVP